MSDAEAKAFQSCPRCDGRLTLIVPVHAPRGQELGGFVDVPLQGAEQGDEFALERGVDLRHPGRPAEIAEAGDAVARVGNSARHDPGKMREVGFDVEARAVQAHPALQAQCRLRRSCPRAPRLYPAAEPIPRPAPRDARRARRNAQSCGSSIPRSSRRSAGHRVCRRFRSRARCRRSLARPVGQVNSLAARCGARESAHDQVLRARRWSRGERGGCSTSQTSSGARPSATAGRRAPPWAQAPARGKETRGDAPFSGAEPGGGLVGTMPRRFPYVWLGVPTHGVTCSPAAAWKLFLRWRRPPGVRGPRCRPGLGRAFFGFGWLVPADRSLHAALSPKPWPRGPAFVLSGRGPGIGRHPSLRC